MEVKAQTRLEEETSMELEVAPVSSRAAKLEASGETKQSSAELQQPGESCQLQQLGESRQLPQASSSRSVVATADAAAAAEDDRQRKLPPSNSC